MQIPGSDAAVLRIKGTPSAASPSSTTATGATATSTPTAAPRRPWPRRRATSPAPGALPVAVTDCLNFGNPEKGEMYWTFEQAVEGMAEACEALETPVVSGNVSFYNESFGNAIYPTPDGRHAGRHRRCDAVRVDHRFKDAGDVVVLLGPLDTAAVDGSEYQKRLFGAVDGPRPRRRPGPREGAAARRARGHRRRAS